MSSFLLKILFIFYIVFYRPNKDKNFNLFVKSFESILGLLTLNISLLINLIATKGSLEENYSYNNDSSDYGKSNYGKFDHKYTFNFWETTGGSLLQFGLTNSLYWCFPKCSNELNNPSALNIPDKFKSYLTKPEISLHKFELFPRNNFGKLFTSIIKIANPYFLIEKKINKDNNEYYKVQLIVYNSLVDSEILTDVWQILESSQEDGAKIILSNKLRNFEIENGKPISKNLGIGNGRSIFIATDCYNNLSTIDLSNL